MRSSSLGLAAACGLLAALSSDARPAPARAGALPAAAGSLRPAKGKLLVAAPEIADPNFTRSVVLLVAYDDDGVMGVIVNQPTPIKLAAIVPGLESLERRGDRIWRGGPVLPRSLLTLVRSEKPPQESETVFDDVRMLTSRDAFERSLKGDTPRERLRAFAGHAGWAPAQLDAEIARGDWTVMPATAEIVFAEAPERVWPKLMERSEGEWTILTPGRSAPG